jgi:hypothetical protein
MIKRDITETVYEYDKEGKLVRKVVTETHEEENNTITTYPSFSQLNGLGGVDALPCTLTDKIRYSDSSTTSTLATKPNCTTTAHI